MLAHRVRAAQGASPLLRSAAVSQWRRGGRRTPVTPRGKLVPLHAKGKTTGSRALDEALDMGKGVVESLAGFVPDNVPRPVAKGGVALAAGVIAFWIVQKVLSTVFTLALLGAGAYLYFRASDSSASATDSSGGGGSSGGAGRGGPPQDADDPLSEARRIMDKYK